MDATPDQQQEEQDIKPLVQDALNSNRQYQSVLDTFASKLAADLHELDVLLATAREADTDSAEEEQFGAISVPGGKKARAPLYMLDLLDEESPFFEDALKRETYTRLTTLHTMRQKDLDALKESVQTENYRIFAFARKREGRNPFQLGQDETIDLLSNTENLDWDSIAEKVSEASNITRTARECEVRWLGEQNPKFNHDPWTNEERAELKRIVSEKTAEAGGQQGGEPSSAEDDAAAVIDWVQVAEELDTGRTVMDCFKNGFKPPLHVWNTRAETRLAEAVEMYGSVDNWSLVAKYVGPQARGGPSNIKWTRAVAPAVDWTPLQDQRLTRAVQLFDSKEKWAEIAPLIPGRTREECRLRWAYLLANQEPTEDMENEMKRKWLEEGDRELFISAIQKVGMHWQEITKLVGKGQTMEQCRAYFVRMETLTGAENDFESSHYIESAKPRTIQSRVRAYGDSYSSKIGSFKVDLTAEAAAPHPNPYNGPTLAAAPGPAIPQSVSDPGPEHAPQGFEMWMPLSTPTNFVDETVLPPPTTTAMRPRARKDKWMPGYDPIARDTRSVKPRKRRTRNTPGESSADADDSNPAAAAASSSATAVKKTGRIRKPRASAKPKESVETTAGSAAESPLTDTASLPAPTQARPRPRPRGKKAQTNAQIDPPITTNDSPSVPSASTSTQVAQPVASSVSQSSLSSAQGNKPRLMPWKSNTRAAPGDESSPLSSLSDDPMKSASESATAAAASGAADTPAGSSGSAIPKPIPGRRRKVPASGSALLDQSSGP